MAGGPPVCDLPWYSFTDFICPRVQRLGRALVAQPHVLLGCTGCARAVMSIGHTPPARTWARILGAGAGYWPSSPHLRKLIEAKHSYLPAKVQLVGNVKHINREKVGAQTVKPCLEDQHVERQYDQPFSSEWQVDIDLDLRSSNRGAAVAPCGTTCVR